MANIDAPKLEVKEGNKDILKGSVEQSADLQREYVAIQKMYTDLKAKLDKMQSARMFGLRGPELDKDAAPLVMSNLSNQLDSLFQDFRAKIKESEENKKTNMDLANANVEAAFAEFKSGMNQIVTSQIDQWVADAKNNPKEAQAQRLAREAMDAAKGKTRDERIAEATK
jgi:hypothetical protein